MAKITKLVCDVCGGPIVVQPGGAFGQCEYCGLQYTIERMREMYEGIKVSQTGSAEDVAQWKQLVNTHVKNFDYTEAERIVKKILEAVPKDEFALDWLSKLQDYKYLKIDHGVLVEYNGHNSNVVVPEGVTVIGEEAFLIRDAVYRGTIKANTFLRSVSLPQTIKEIHPRAFHQCTELEIINLPEGLIQIGYSAFQGCSSLKEISFPSSLKSMGDFAFCYCENLRKVMFKDGCNVTGPGSGWFNDCGNITGTNALDILPPQPLKHFTTNIFDKKNLFVKLYIKQKRCLNCGQIRTKSWVTGKCKNCGQPISEW